MESILHHLLASRAALRTSDANLCCDALYLITRHSPTVVWWVWSRGKLRCKSERHEQPHGQQTVWIIPKLYTLNFAIHTYIWPSLSGSTYRLGKWKQKLCFPQILCLTWFLGRVNQKSRVPKDTQKAGAKQQPTLPGYYRKVRSSFREDHVSSASTLHPACFSELLALLPTSNPRPTSRHLAADSQAWELSAATASRSAPLGSPWESSSSYLAVSQAWLLTCPGSSNLSQVVYQCFRQTRVITLSLTVPTATDEGMYCRKGKSQNFQAILLALNWH